MAAGNIAGQGLARRREDEPSVFFILEEPIGVEAPDHIADAGLRNPEALGDVHDPGVPLGIDELENAFEVILDRGRIAPVSSRAGHGGEGKKKRGTGQNKNIWRLTDS